MKRILTAVLLLSVLFVPLLETAASDITLPWCAQFGQIGYIIVETPQGDQLTILKDTQLALMAAWQPTVNLWKPQGSYGTWNVPADTQETYLFDVRTEDLQQHYLVIETSKLDPAHVWVFAYQDFAVTTDANGQHAGIHDYGCGNGAASHFELASSALVPLLPPSTAACPSS